MTVIKSVIILDANNSPEYYTLSLDEFDKMPYRKDVGLINGSFAPLFKGDIIDISYEKTGPIWTKEYDYKNHYYDIVVVLGKDKSNSNLIVYGNKFGEQVISNTHRKVFAIERGDELLLEKICAVPKNPYRIVHNITQTKLKYEMYQNGPRIR